MRVLKGINIQWPWSELLLSTEKTIETRSYPLPEALRGVPLALIETPGPRGRKEAGILTARITGVITFRESKEYLSKSSWEKDFKNHRVDPKDPNFRFKAGKRKFGWIVESVERLAAPVPPPQKRGIVYATRCVLPD